MRHTKRPNSNFSPAVADARPRWRKFLSQPELYARDEDFSVLLASVAAGLQGLCGTKSQVLFLTSAGTGALECAIAALRKDTRIVVLRNGAFGQRLFEIALIHHKDVFPFDVAFGQPFGREHEGALVRLIEEKKAEVILCVHLETSSTVLNDVALVGRIGREHQAITLIDGVSSIGAVPCRLDEWGVNGYVASAYKALMCPPGLSFIIADEAFLKLADRKWSYYFDLRRLTESAQASRFLWMPLVLSLQCLQGTLDEIFSVGQEAYFAKLQQKARLFRYWLASGGLEIFGDSQYLSPCFTALQLKRDNAGVWLAQLKREYGIIVGKGVGDEADRLIRIGHYPHQSRAALRRLAQALVSVAEQDASLMSHNEDATLRI